MMRFHVTGTDVRISPILKERLARRREPDTQPASSRSGLESPTRVLVVDDEAAIRDSLRELLRREFEVVTAGSAAEALELLEEEAPALVLSDQRMPGTTGSQLLARVFQVAPEVTRILITGYADLGAVIEAVNDGRIFYYVTKPWEADQLLAIVRRGAERNRLLVENRRLLDELRRANRELEERVRRRTEDLEQRNRDLEEARQRVEELLRVDPLTGVANRRRLEEALDAEIEEGGRYAAPFSVIMVDLDHFKQVNDRYGHVVGDVTLQQAAHALATHVRRVDLVGRFGGEEFLIVSPHTGVADAGRLAERLRAVLEVQEMPFAGRITASFGVAEWRAGESRAELVGRADAALYRAKEKGRNRVVVS